MFAGLGVLMIIAPINAVLVRWNRKYSKLGIEEKDKRMKLMNEILNGIKVKPRADKVPAFIILHFNINTKNCLWNDVNCILKIFFLTYYP